MLSFLADLVGYFICGCIVVALLFIFGTEVAIRIKAWLSSL